MTGFDQVLLAGLAWLLLGTAVRFMTTGGIALAPAAASAWRLLWCKGGTRQDCAYRFYRELDNLYIKLMGALTTSASAALVYAGMMFMGAGLVVRVSSSVLRYTGDQQGFWVTWSQFQNLVSSPMLVIGMSFIIAAVSKRRTASLIMSAGFVLAGLGIGIVTTSTAFQ